jgi:Cu/Ag efflux pump CusA
LAFTNTSAELWDTKALGLGSGAELQKPLAIAVIGGLSVSTIVTLVFLPTLMPLLPQRSTPTNIQGRS